MSLLVFPAFDPPYWNATWPVKQTPMFNTIIQRPASGRGVIRIGTYQFPLWNFSFNISYIKGDATGVNTAWQILVNFFMAVQGQGSDWLFLHPWDSLAGSYAVPGAVTFGIFKPNEMVVQTGTGATATTDGDVFGTTMYLGPITGTANGTGTWVGQTSDSIFSPSGAPAVNTTQAIATGDGVTTAFTMFRTIVTSGAQDMIQNFVTPPLIFVNGSLVSSSTYSINEYGTLTFNTAPAAAATISWLGQFYYRCSFLDDQWEDLEESLYQIWNLEEMKFRSVLL
jgi:hypothetical protein